MINKNIFSINLNAGNFHETMTGQTEILQVLNAVGIASAYFQNLANVSIGQNF